MLNQQSPLLRTLTLMITALIVVGCKPHRTIDGHTEIIKPDGTVVVATDDGDHCFMRDDSRNLVLIVKAPEIKKDKRVFPFLFDLIKGSVEDKPTLVISDGIATVTYHGHTENRARPLHLGPGPYVAATAMPQQTTSTMDNIVGTQPVTLAYPYVTYAKDRSECPVAGYQR